VFSARARQGEALEAAEAARLFEGQLAGALVAEDGQLALSTLAASAAHGFMPRIQTQGQLGQARWRFVSAPSIPGARPPHAPCAAHPALCVGDPQFAPVESLAVKLSRPHSQDAGACHILMQHRALRIDRTGCWRSGSL